GGGVDIGRAAKSDVGAGGVGLGADGVGSFGGGPADVSAEAGDVVATEGGLDALGVGELAAGAGDAAGGLAVDFRGRGRAGGAALDGSLEIVRRQRRPALDDLLGR